MKANEVHKKKYGLMPPKDMLEAKAEKKPVKPPAETKKKPKK